MNKLGCAFSLLLAAALASGCGNDTVDFTTSSSGDTGSSTSTGSMGLVPSVASVTPTDKTTAVPTGSLITATFSAAMDPESINSLTFTLTKAGTAVLGTVTYDSGTATFKPTAKLATDADYVATITAKAQSAAGTPLGKDFSWSFKAGQAPLDLDVAAPYAILAANTITNVMTPGTVITGDLGLSPGNTLTGFPPGKYVGKVHAGDSASALALKASTAAYADALARLTPIDLAADLKDLTLTPGLYKGAADVTLSSGNLTLDAKGAADAIFIFQIGAGLTTSKDTQIILAGGAKASNVYWAVATSATLGPASKFKGTLLATTAITMQTGASIEGRLQAQLSNVALDSNTVTIPGP
jgi:hypothetical protein